VDQSLIIYDNHLYMIYVDWTLMSHSSKMNNNTSCIWCPGIRTNFFFTLEL